MKFCVVGEGAFGKKHLDNLLKTDDIDVEWLVGGDIQETKSVAQRFNIPYWTCDLQEALASKSLKAVILASPTPLHAKQAIQVMLAGKHVLIEIPMADNLKDAQALVKVQSETAVIAMVGHLRRFNLGHQWIYNKVIKGELSIQQMHAQTYFFRRTNSNALGEPRNWTDSLLWHHACHTVDLFQYQTQQNIDQCFVLQGPQHPALGIAMDMSVGMKAHNGAICTLSLSFNNEGPLGSVFRYICNNGTYIAKNDELHDGNGNVIELTGKTEAKSGVELIQQEFIRAIRTGDEPNASVKQCLQTMHTLHKMSNILDQAQ